MAHDDDVRVVTDHEDGVFERLALGGAGGRCVLEANDASAEPIDRRLKAEPRAGGRLEEKCGNDAPTQEVAVRTCFKPGGIADDAQNVCLRTLIDGN